jgi:ribosomal-protein-serine acetyltransferase
MANPICAPRPVAAMIGRMDTPPEHLRNASVDLRRWRATDAELCLRLVSESLEHLRPWMSWAASGYGPRDAADYVRRCEDDWAARTSFSYLILAGGIPAGSAGLMARIGEGGLEIGYWVHPGFTGRGVATSAAAALTDAAFGLPGVDHVEIHHDLLNLASERVPAKLGFAHVGTVPSMVDLAPGDCGTSKVWRITR